MITLSPVPSFDTTLEPGVDGKVQGDNVGRIAAIQSSARSVDQVLEYWTVLRGPGKVGLASQARTGPVATPRCLGLNVLVGSSCHFGRDR
jgi:hypothetical protein